MVASSRGLLSGIVRRSNKNWNLIGPSARRCLILPRNVPKRISRISRALTGRRLADQLRFPKHRTGSLSPYLNPRRGLVIAVTATMPSWSSARRLASFRHLPGISVTDEPRLSRGLPDQLHDERATGWRSRTVSPRDWYQCAAETGREARICLVLRGQFRERSQTSAASACPASASVDASEKIRIWLIPRSEPYRART